ncbi:secreted RxLR effector protein 161-like [Bradysia coprophila]|uniref:secreted RxLR effector protein 161-like n=1 Tax=Bradysia coprophila TaxID=38358 RepID=UPI00187D8019|nr:secreted RxLR effector protein 161-like [Bradysia coprophila]
MKDLGRATNCVGIRITYNQNSICLDQSTYIAEVLKRFGMADSKPVSTPSDVNQKLSMNATSNNEEDENITGKVPYQELVGCLLFIAQGTRPDIAFAVNDVSRFNQNHRAIHWKAVKRILRYLQGTIGCKLRYSKNGNQDLVGYTDSDWASDIDKRRSCSGNFFKLSGGAVSWYSKRQQTVALSTTEAEYMAWNRFG